MGGREVSSEWVTGNTGEQVGGHYLANSPAQTGLHAIGEIVQRIPSKQGFYMNALNFSIFTRH